MRAFRGTAQLRQQDRPAFALYEGYTLTNVIAALDMVGVIEDLENSGIEVGKARHRNVADAELLEASLRYLVQRGILEEESGIYTLSPLGEAVCQDKGYLVWLSGSYGEALRSLDALLRGTMRYGEDVVRDGHWVAEGSALIGRRDVAPEAMKLLEGLPFQRVVDLGCGNARFLLSVCRTFDCDGVGVDISSEACEDAFREIQTAGLADRVQVIRGDAMDLAPIPKLDTTDLVVSFFMLHEIASQNRFTVVDFFTEMASRLPAGAYLLIGEVAPPQSRPTEPPELFTPEFALVHAVMRQSLPTEQDWREMLEEAGFAPRRVVPVGVPGAFLMLGQKIDREH